MLSHATASLLSGPCLPLSPALLTANPLGAGPPSHRAGRSLPQVDICDASTDHPPPGQRNIAIPLRDQATRLRVRAMQPCTCCMRPAGFVQHAANSAPRHAKCKPQSNIPRRQGRGGFKMRAQCHRRAHRTLNTAPRGPEWGCLPVLSNLVKQRAGRASNHAQGGSAPAEAPVRSHCRPPVRPALTNSSAHDAAPAADVSHAPPLIAAAAAPTGPSSNCQCAWHQSIAPLASDRLPRTTLTAI